VLPSKIALLIVNFLISSSEVRMGVLPFTYRPVKVTVVDEETGGPIANAKVAVYYEDVYLFNSPEPDSALVDSHGTATVIVAAGATDYWISYESRGYYGPVRTRHSPFPSQMKVTLKRLPSISLTVPNGYTGPIKFNLPKQPAGGSRDISRNAYDLHADANGNVTIEDVETVAIYDELVDALKKSFVTASYEDGREIPVGRSDDVKNSTIALRHVAHMVRMTKTADKSRDFLVIADGLHTRNRELYVIGTAKDQEDLRSSPPEFEAKDEEDERLEVR
jgi:hypothetical protein